ncbi:MAG: hypothetical protein R3C58_15425 [Parvularculaceae bacterium]
MAITRFTRAGIGAICVAALASSPAMAGRCGGFYPVDAPTTLTKVARACNVSLAALKEANPGVDPGYVAPGENLAVPDEGVGAAAEVPAVADGGDLDDAYADNPLSNRYVEYRDTGVRLASATQSPAPASSQPYFYRTSLTGGGSLPHTEQRDRSTFQKRSAERIRAAGLSMNPTPAVAPLYSPSTPEFISAAPGEPLSPLMECVVLRRMENGKIGQVREFKPIPQGRETPAHCSAMSVSMRAPVATAAPAIIAPVSLPPSPFAELPPIDEPVMLSGYVSSYSDGCLTLISDDGQFSRIDARGMSDGLVGREATLWVEYTDAAACGGAALDHAVYAERVPSVGSELTN